MGERFATNGFEVEIRRKRIKNMYLRIGENGKLIVSAPRWISLRKIGEFVVSKDAWIRKEQKRLREKSEKQKVSYVNGELYPLWGQKVELSPYAENDTIEQRKKKLQNFYKQELEKNVELLLPQWEERTGLFCKEWRARSMKTRWGSCNSKAKRIWLNVELAKYPAECLEYVILHELVHLKVQNHGPQFKALMTKFMPNWKARKKILNDFGS